MIQFDEYFSTGLKPPPSFYMFLWWVFVWWRSPIAGDLIDVSSTRISRLCWQPKLHEGLCQPRRSFRKCWRCWRERSCLAQDTMPCWREQRMKPKIGVLEDEFPSSCVWVWGWILCLLWMAYISEPSLVDQQKVVHVDKLSRIHHLPDPVTHLHLFQMQKFPSISFLSLEALNESRVFFCVVRFIPFNHGGHNSFRTKIHRSPGINAL